MTILGYVMLFATIVLSGASFFLFKKINHRYLKLLLAFSGAYLFALTILHLIPEAYEAGGHSIGMYILLGFFIQIILEFFSEGIEHGHIHIHRHQNAAFPYGVMFGLCLHSFLEGIPLSHRFAESETQNSLLAGIILHHMPVALALMSMLVDSGLTRKTAFAYLVIFAAMAPFGALTGSFMGGESVSNMSVYYSRIMAVVIGIFLHISTTILFESNEQHRFNYIKIIVILLGGALALV